MSLQTRLKPMLDAIGGDIKGLRQTLFGTPTGNLNALTTADKSSIVAAINELKSASGKIHPVGSIYMSTTATNPASTLGFGTWVAWGNGRVPVGVDAGQSEFSSVELSGGEKQTTLTEDQIPPHTHSGNTTPVNVTASASTSDRTSAASAGSFVAMDSGVAGGPIVNISNSNHSHPFTTDSGTGGGGAHNNLQPYITCYMWKRTA